MVAAWRMAMKAYQASGEGYASVGVTSENRKSSNSENNTTLSFSEK